MSAATLAVPRGRPRSQAAILALSAILTIALGVLLLTAPPPAGAQAPAPIWVTRVDGSIDPPLASYLVATMRRAQEAGAGALIIELDTPGGLDTAMREIIQATLESPVPVVFYVFPAGARAASAGVYMLMAADVAAMAPQTNLGAASPVSLTGQMDETMKAKVTNDAAAYIRALASSHGRNAEWAEQAVREGVSLTAEEALDQNVIDLVATSREDLLRRLDGRPVESKSRTIETEGATVHEVSMGWREGFFHRILDPNIAFILLLLGIFGLIFELTNPGMIAPGVAGAIALLLAAYAFQILPVNLVGLGLVGVAIALFVAEIKIISHGVLAIGATVALVLGGMLLFDSPDSAFRIDWWTLAVGAVTALGFFAFAVRAVRRAYHAQTTTGSEELIGVTGPVRTPLDPVGQVLIHGEIWRASSEEGRVEKGEHVEVTAVEGLTLRVRRSPNR